MLDSFEVVDLADWTRGESEPAGAEAKRWFIAPASSRHTGHWLFKPRRIKNLKLSKERQKRGDKPDVLVRGEDWAEKISYELAKLLEIPAAETQLAAVIQLHTGSAIDSRGRRIGHAARIVVEKMAASIERHRCRHVARESLHDVDVSGCTDRRSRRRVSQAVRYQPFDPGVFCTRRQGRPSRQPCCPLTHRHRVAVIPTAENGVCGY